MKRTRLLPFRKPLSWKVYDFFWRIGRWMGVV